MRTQCGHKPFPLFFCIDGCCIIVTLHLISPGRTYIQTLKFPYVKSTEEEIKQFMTDFQLHNQSKTFLYYNRLHSLQVTLKDEPKKGKGYPETHYRGFILSLTKKALQCSVQLACSVQLTCYLYS